MELVIHRDKLESSTERERGGGGGEKKGKQQEREEWRRKKEKCLETRKIQKMWCGNVKGKKKIK